MLYYPLPNCEPVKVEVREMNGKNKELWLSKIMRYLNDKQIVRHWIIIVWVYIHQLLACYMQYNITLLYIAVHVCGLKQ